MYTRTHTLVTMDPSGNAGSKMKEEDTWLSRAMFHERPGASHMSSMSDCCTPSALFS